MRPATIARNYAEALFELGEAKGAAQAYGDWLESLAGAVSASAAIEAVLMSPRVTKAQKQRILAEGLAGAPREVVLFLQAVVKRGRQALFGTMALEYQGLLDVKFNRVRAGVTVARPASETLQRAIIAAIAKVVGKDVIARFEVDSSILGGVVVRVGDRFFDGLIRRRMATLRRLLLAR